MRVTVTLEHRFVSTPDGRFWTDSTFDRAFWDAYLEVFDDVRVVARVRPVDRHDSVLREASGPGVELFPIPYYVGPSQYVRRLADIRSAAASLITRNDAYVFRVPSPISGWIVPRLRAIGHPYALEVVGDPADVFARGAISHPLRPVIRAVYVAQLKRQARHSVAASYVTERALQARYRCSGFTTGISSIRMDDSYLAREPKRFDGGTLNLIQVGTLEELYKAPDVTLAAVRECVARGLDVKLTLVGGGRRQAELQRMADEPLLRGRVRFTGTLQSGSAVRAELDHSDLFVLPSRQEGLPRAMIEGMGRGLPAIGSLVGGIPELLPREDLVPPGNVAALATKIAEFGADPARMRAAAARNLERARGYCASVLRPKRRAFYEFTRAATERSLERREGMQA
jgi:glycosyltransferase involved in cell wall biosynthesis